MKKNYLFGSLAFAALLASCSNELETATEAVKQEVAMEEVVGATLVSEGLSIKLNGMESRAANGAWLAGDKLGLAWYNVENSISEEQTTTSWALAMENYATLTEQNYRIFANHKFTAQEGSSEFVTESNVYQGAHFVYFPYKYESKISKKVVDVNSDAFSVKPEGDTANASDESFDMANKAFQLSAQDFISEVNEDGVLEQEFVLEPMVNSLRIKATPKFEDSSDDLKKLTIKRIEVKSTQDVFSNQLTINPAEVPAVVLDEENEIDHEATKLALNTYAMNASGKEYTKTLTRNVEAVYDLTATRNMNIFTLPTKSGYTGGEGNGLSIKVYVESENGLQGNFDIKRNSRNTTTNKTTINTLEERLGATSPYTLQGIVKTTAGKWTHTNLNVELTENNVNFTWNIADINQWNDAVALASEIGKDVEFNLVGDVEFEGTTVNFPTCKLTVVGSKALVLKGAAMEWPADANVDLTAANIIVEEGTTLAINGTAEKRNALVANVTNKGTIALNEYAKISKKDNGQIENANARIEVKYGSYVYANSGIVAFEVETETPAYQINNLITDDNTDTDDGQALVNTLVVNEGEVLNLSASSEAKTTYDPYSGTTITVPAVYLTSLSAIDIEMNGGSIIAGVHDEKSVNNVDVKSGVNVIKDATIVGNLNVATGAEVTIDATEHSHGTSLVKHEKEIGEILNDGLITAATTVVTNNIDNEDGSIVVNENRIMWYTGEYAQGGSAQGKIYKKEASAMTTSIVVTPDMLATFEPENNVAYMLSGNFNGNVSIRVPIEVENVEFNGANATNINELIINQGEGDFSNASDPRIKRDRKGKLTIKKFQNVASQINVITESTEVEICNNKAEALAVVGGNIDLNIHDNSFDANFEVHKVYRNGALETAAGDSKYAVLVQAINYELRFDNNIVTDSYGHLVAINALAGNGDAWAALAVDNKIHSFTGNDLTVNTNMENNCAAFKIWADYVYAPQDASTIVNTEAKKLINSILSGGNNIVKNSNHYNFSIYQVNTNN